MFRPILASIIPAIMWAGAAGATDLDCRSSFILSNYETGEDVQMASLVTRSIYEQIAESNESPTTIFGVPAGKNYVQFRRWISLMKAEQPAVTSQGKSYQVASANCATAVATQSK